MRLKHAVCAIFAAVFAAHGSLLFAQTPPPPAMTNAVVIQMVSAGLNDEIIVSAIQGAAVKTFDVSPSGLIQLKTAKVSDRVIVAMQSGTSIGPRMPSASGHQSGLFATVGAQQTKLQSSVARTKGPGIGRSLLSSASGGLTRTPSVLTIEGAKSTRTFPANVEFRFYFDPANPASYQSTGMILTPANIVNLVLVRLKTGRNEPSLDVGGTSALKIKAGVREEDMVKILTEQQTDAYVVKPAEPLAPGEYAFVVQEETPLLPGSLVSPYLFDFRVTP